MKALVKTEPGVTDLHIMDIPKPVCPDNGVLLKVRAVGLCGSDIHYYKWTEPMPLPQIMGHEFCGDIVEIGKDVTDWKIGDFVISKVPVYPCGSCVYCQNGHPDKCASKRIAGLTAPGAYAEYVVTYPENLFLVPEGVSEEMAACCEPASVVLHAVRRFGLTEEHKTAVVVGVGIIGLLTIQFLRIFGVKEIIAVGMDSDECTRLPLAQKYGATKCINAQHRSSSEQILEYTKGYKVDIAVDCSGSVKAIEELFKVIRKRGIFGAIGVPPTGATVAVDWNALVWSSINIISSFGSDYEDWKDTVEMMGDGRLMFQDAITHTINLENWEKIFKNSSNPEYVKAVIKPWLVQE